MTSNYTANGEKGAKDVQKKIKVKSFIPKHSSYHFCVKANHIWKQGTMYWNTTVGILLSFAEFFKNFDFYKG